MRSSLSLLLGLLVLSAVGCDSDDLDDRDLDVRVRVANFTLDDRDFDFDFDASTSGREVQYESRAFPELTQSAVDDGVVLLYVSDVVDADGLRREGWTALPLTLGFDIDDDFFVDYTTTLTYTYDVNTLYVNLIGSDDFTIEDFVDLGEFEDVLFKLVAIPGGSFARGIDYADYEAVKRAYGLPD
ncbi:MAG: hypothetical protein R3362_08570 [Rhodothermales bacterium]|nr:hypothetical protein [Rhodothermales bacterium]